MPVCKGCGVDKETSEFGKCKVKKSGITGKCKDCLKKYATEFRFKNKERLKKYSAEWEAKNKEVRAKNKAEWFAKNKDKVTTYSKEYRLNNLEQARVRKQRFYDNNPKKCSELSMRWARRNRDLVRAYVSMRRAKLISATPRWANIAKISEFYKYCEQMQIITGEKYTVDHIVPLASKLVCGLHWEGNLQILTVSENCSKGNRNWPDMP